MTLFEGVMQADDNICTPHRVSFYGFRAGQGGISHVMRNLMNSLIDQQSEVDLLLHHTDIPELSELRPEIRVIQLPKGDGLKRIPPLIGYLRQVCPTVLMVNREAAVRAAIHARRFSGVPTRVAIRVGMTISMALDRRHPIKRFLRWWGIVYCYRRADYIIANSQGVADDIVRVTKLPRNRTAIIDNPTVSTEMFHEAEEIIDHPWFRPRQPPVITAVGRLARQKDFPTLLRAYARLRSRTPCRLMILGEGKERQVLEDLAGDLGIGEDLALPGYVANPFPYMRRSALFVLSSAWEGSPNVLIQAMALGVPVVATDCHCGPRHILANGHYGPLVPVGDARALCHAMLRTLNLPPERSVLQSAANRFRAADRTRDYMAAMGLITDQCNAAA